jgi:hypothetical protein
MGPGGAAISAGWVLIGIGILASPFAWCPVPARYASGVPLALASAVSGLATLAPRLVPGLAGFALATVWFGIAVVIGSGAVTRFGRQTLPCAFWGSPRACSR